MHVSVSPAQEMLSASISQTRILQTCSVPHANMVNGANSLQGTHPNLQPHDNDDIHAYAPFLTPVEFCKQNSHTYSFSKSVRINHLLSE